MANHERKIQFSVTTKFSMYEKIEKESWDKRTSKAEVVNKALELYFSKKPKDKDDLEQF